MLTSSEVNEDQIIMASQPVNRLSSQAQKTGSNKRNLGAQDMAKVTAAELKDSCETLGQKVFTSKAGETSRLQINNASLNQSLID